MYGAHTIFLAGKYPYGHIRCAYMALASPTRKRQDRGAVSFKRAKIVRDANFTSMLKNAHLHTEPLQPHTLPMYKYACTCDLQCLEDVCLPTNGRSSPAGVSMFSQHPPDLDWLSRHGLRRSPERGFVGSEAPSNRSRPDTRASSVASKATER